MELKNNLKILNLLKRWQNGDKQAYETIYELYYKYVYYIAYQFFHNHEKAEDAVQEAFLEAYYKIQTLKELSAFQSWIKQIVYHKCLNQLTYEKKDALSYSRPFFNDETDGNNFYHEDISIERIQLDNAIKVIVVKLSELDERKRMIGYLHFLEGYKAREIAEIMGINRDTVNTNIRRIKLLLKDELKKEHYSPIETMSLLVFPKLSSTYNDAQEKMLKSSHSNSQNHMKFLNKNIITIAMGTLCFSTLTIINKDYLKELFSSLQETKIISVDYSKELTNKPITIDVSISNQNYDDIYINNELTNVISSSGIYIINIKRDEKILDQKQIVINNIDTLPPYIKGKEENQDTVILYLKDDYGIDYSHIEVYKNNQKSNDFSLDKERERITLSRELNTVYTLKVFDIAGNRGEFSIKSYEKEI